MQGRKRHVSPTEREEALEMQQSALIAENARYRKVLGWMASFSDEDLKTAKTLHYDMVGKAKEVLRAGSHPPAPEWHGWLPWFWSLLNLILLFVGVWHGWPTGMLVINGIFGLVGAILGSLAALKQMNT